MIRVFEAVGLWLAGRAASRANETQVERLARRRDALSVAVIVGGLLVVLSAWAEAMFGADWLRLPTDAAAVVLFAGWAVLVLGGGPRGPRGPSAPCGNGQSRFQRERSDKPERKVCELVKAAVEE